MRADCSLIGAGFAARETLSSSMAQRSGKLKVPECALPLLACYKSGLHLNMFTKRTNWRLESNLLAQAIERHRQSGRALLDLTISNPTMCGFIYPEAEILATLSDKRALTYLPES